MKKLKNLFFVLIASLLIIPLTVFAEGEEEENATTTGEELSKEVIVYFFRGQGCSHCAEAEEWFESIEEELGDKFEIQDYEVWNDPDNSELMEKVAKARGEEDTATGVPYIIIGDQSWIGFTSDYKSEIKSKINKMYEQDVNKRYDIMLLLDDLLDGNGTDSDKKGSNDVVTLLLILVICGGIGYGIYTARKKVQ